MRAKAVLIDRTLILKDKIWTARLRTGHVAIFQASDSRAFRAAALIGLAAEEAVIASAGEADSAAIDSVVAGDLGAVALAVLADSVAEDFAGAAGSGADGEN